MTNVSAGRDQGLLVVPRLSHRWIFLVSRPNAQQFASPAPTCACRLKCCSAVLPETQLELLLLRLPLDHNCAL